MKDTFVYGVHIAAAVGSEAILNMRNISNRIFGGLYELDPYGVALLKDSVVTTMPERIFSEHLSHRYLMNHFIGIIITCTRSSQSTLKDMVKLEIKNIIEFCVAKADVQRLRAYLDIYGYELFRNYPESVKAINLSHRLNLTEVTELLLQHNNNIIETDMMQDKIESFVKLFIALNEPQLLEKILDHAHAIDKDVDLNMTGLEYVCKVLQRKDCKRLIVNAKQKLVFLDSHKRKISNSDEMKSFLEFLLDDHLRDEIVAILQQMPDLPAFLNSGNKGETWLHRCSNVHVMKCLFDFGLDINMTTTAHKTPLTVIFETLAECCEAMDRYIIELCIFENPDPEKHKSILRHAILNDENAYNPPRHALMDQSYEMDGKHHGMYGHDGTEFALNFTLPLLIESGVITLDEEVEFVLVTEEDRDVHPAVVDYLKRSIKNPKPLGHLSCMVLRRYFKGCKIHKYRMYSQWIFLD